MLKIRIAIPFAGLALTACGQSEAGRPNVIYVFPDQYRNSSLGFWSDPEFAAEVGWKGDPVATPNLDRFAREATVLTEAVSNFPDRKSTRLNSSHPLSSRMPSSA